MELANAQLSNKCGLYWNPDDDLSLKIILKEGKLYAAYEDESYELKPLSEYRFRWLDAPVEFLFRAEKPGGPLKLTISFPWSPDNKPQVFEAVVPVTLTPAQLGEYVGSYHSDEIDPLYRITLEDGKLVVKRPKFKPVILEPASRDLFFAASEALEGSLRFTRDGAGRVSGIVLNAGGDRNFRFTKQLP